MNIKIYSKCFGLMFGRFINNNKQFHFIMKQYAGSMKMLGDTLTKPGTVV